MTEVHYGATQQPSIVPENPSVHSLIIAGISIILIFFLGLFSWGKLAPLQSAAIAEGTVSLDTYSKTIQHLEGGIISKLYVKEGSLVTQGQVLLSLEKTQLESKIERFNARRKSIEDQLDLINDELFEINILYKKGLATKSRVLALKRRNVELEGEKTETIASLKAVTDQIQRTEIMAPIDGTIVSLSTHTVGGVIKPGEKLLSIVPNEELFTIEARLNPNDIDVVKKDMEAIVRLTPLNARTVPPLKGYVMWTSADKLSDQQTGVSYYLVRIKLTSYKKFLPKGVDLHPGMPAEVMIVTGNRTFWQYLITPIQRGFGRAFREQ